MDLDNTLNRYNWVSNFTIDKSKLKQSQYMLSLLKEGQNVGAITSEKAYQIQVEMMQILQRLIDQHTQGESTSVTTETAEGIMISLLYAMDAYALHFEKPEEVLVHLHSDSVKKIYTKGVELLHYYFEEAKQLYQDVKKMKLDVPVDAYNLTIDESLPIFMNNYNIIFEAQNTMASIDYPLATDNMQLQGVFYIKQYLERLLIETRFCHFFNHQDLMYVLTNFGRICRFNYRIELFNIFELMINNAVFSLLSGSGANQVRISEVQYDRLSRLLSDCHADKRANLINEAFDQLQRDLKTDQTLTSYINLYREEFIQRVNNAAEIDNFKMLIIREIEENEKPMVLMLNENDRMSDIEIRKLVDCIMGSESIAEKISLIRDHFVSLHDYLDLLNSGCLFDDEYNALFATFENFELAIFAKIVFYEELRGGIRNFFDIIADCTEAKSEWETYYIKFIKQLEDERIATVGHLIEDIDYEEISFY
ncbi:DUF6179 domain-containing protein [Bacillus inaquosorum]|uniref:DUF6179 domain-containing protein n=1 Tax=Bacillus inaquosorum TaxID=483913 RepID=UPI00227EFD67|nr:DUF6179 domain-containing protein [Bacillus inaquosorum]MCY7951305.1 DUF6179 domain-containing protein [Bacillus inaquosorum]MCY8794853.1 DUF6179 domain-containing protein [Bacillus inaquosorum]MEC0544152.1 DUF6179 domain-containing protein [Bacillus inaquosorum]MEC0605681.1 DUF6179 domain-containing protein [Bacillus inaquosorum]MEC0769611.1 DUF6179 domain-containing protein [Bacillus inaquosorum]